MAGAVAGDDIGDDAGNDVVAEVAAAGDSATDSRTAASYLPPALCLVHGRPLIHHPLSLLLLAGIRHILVVAPPPHLPHFQHRLGGGERWGVHLSYAFQPAGGAARAVVAAAEFTGDRPLALAFAGHIFHGPTLPEALQKAATLKKGARLLAAPTSTSTGRALTGLAFYDHTAPSRVRALAASRPESSAAPLGIPDLNDAYCADGALEVETLGAEVAWFCVRGRDSLPAAEAFVRGIEKNQGGTVGCPEEAARRMGFIADRRLPEDRARPRRG